MADTSPVWGGQASRFERSGSATGIQELGLLCALSLTAFNCGGDSVSAPAAPAPPTVAEPAPSPPAQVTGVQVAEVGQDYILWTWDPAETATGYEAAAALLGTPPDERVVEYVEEPSFRAEGFQPGSDVMILVRAVRETAGGRAAGPWSSQVVARTWGEPRACTDEWERARRFSHWNDYPDREPLISEWNGKPFRFYADRMAMSQTDGEWVLHEARKLSDHIERQIGYLIFEVEGWTLEGGPEFDPDNFCAVRGKSGEIIASINPEGVGGAAVPRCAVFWWSGGRVDRQHPGTLAHELFHLFGFAHHPQFNKQPPERGGVAMSLRLQEPGPDQRPTYEDVDALRCIFPERGNH